MAHPRQLALILSTPEERGDFAAALALARAARDANIEVGMFFMADAVAALPRQRAAIAGLVDHGVEVIACASSAHGYGLSEGDCGMLLGSQDDHAALVHGADRVVAFT